MDQAAHFDAVRQDLTAILADLPSAWGDDARREVRTMMEAGEFGLALETIAFVAVEDRLTLPPKAMEEFEALAARMGMDQQDAIRRLRDHQGARAA